MNSGLSNLAILKAWLLPAGLLTGTDYDTAIAAIGLGVARQLEKHCNRLFVRTAGDTYECTADRPHVILPRFPVEVLTSVQRRATAADAWADVSAEIEQQDLARGYIEFGGDLGSWTERLKFTYTGGFFFETLEPGAGGYPTATPSGSTALPEDLRLAWLLQCEHTWSQRDKLGLQIGEKPSAAPALTSVELLATVREYLRPYVRYSLT